MRLHRISSINLFTKAILLFGELKISTAHNAYIQIHPSTFSFTQENAFVAHVQFSEFYMLFHYLELQSAIFNFCNSFSEFDCVASLSPSYTFYAPSLSISYTKYGIKIDFIYLLFVKKSTLSFSLNCLIYNVDVKKNYLAQTMKGKKTKDITFTLARVHPIARACPAAWAEFWNFNDFGSQKDVHVKMSQRTNRIISQSVSLFTRRISSFP